MSSTPEFDQTQLAAARATVWHQDGAPLLTLEAARDWIRERGLVLFAPRPQQLPAPAASFVEATLGAANPAPAAAESAPARSLLARLVAEGHALPLNLLGVPTAQAVDVPDFVVSAQMFSFLFTLRGDKAWKQPPSTSGAIKVSPLGLRIYEVLTEKGALSATDLAAELGREVTEAAILRSLTELWSQLRVLPLLQPGDASALWELTTARFTKAIKAGANAGQPTALSALLSLYLAQALAATEDEIATFLSPLTARSRIREVVHALLGARQLETVAVAGKTLLHLPGSLAAVGAAAASAAQPGEDLGIAAGGDDAAAREAALPRPKKIGTGRISSFRSERPAAGELRGRPARGFGDKPARGFGDKPARSFGAKPARGFGDKPRRAFGDKPARSFGDKPRRAFGDKPARSFGAKPRFGAAGSGSRPDRERRPFRRDAAPAGEQPSSAAGKPTRAAGKSSYAAGKPSFTKPWNEDRQAERREARPAGRKPRPADAAAPDAFRKFRRPAPEDRPPLGEREQAGLPPERRSRPPFPRGPREGALPRAAGGFAGRDAGPAAKPGAKFGSKPGAKFGSKAGAKFGGKPASKFGSKPGAKFGSKPGAKFGSKPGAEFGGKPASKFGSKPGAKFGSKPASKFGSKPGAKFGSKPASKFGSKRKGTFGAKGSSFGARPFAPGAKPGGKPGARPVKAAARTGRPPRGVNPRTAGRRKPEAEA